MDGHPYAGSVSAHRLDPLSTRRPRLKGITEFVITYDERPSYTVSIMEFRDGKVARETQYFADPFEPGPSRAQWVEPMR